MSSLILLLLLGELLVVYATPVSLCKSLAIVADNSSRVNGDSLSRIDWRITVSDKIGKDGQSSMDDIVGSRGVERSGAEWLEWLRGNPVLRLRLRWQRGVVDWSEGSRL